MAEPSRVFMVRPLRFGKNPETMDTNTFQSASFQQDESTGSGALKEFDALVALLRSHGVEVIIWEEKDDQGTPDSIFPNNWISFHETGIFLYPMMAENRRRERSNAIVEFLKPHVAETRVVDLSIHEQRGLFLEGTGSLVIDHERRIVYAASSPRTSEILVNDWARMHGMIAVCFKTQGDVYHTNVLLTVGKDFALLGSELIPDLKEREKVISFLERSGKKIVHLTNEQISAFAGNAYELFNADDQRLLLMSERAYRSLTQAQLETLASRVKIIHAAIPTIESAAGGSVRCMIADMNSEDR